MVWLLTFDVAILMQRGKTGVERRRLALLAPCKFKACKKLDLVRIRFSGLRPLMLRRRGIDSLRRDVKTCEDMARASRRCQCPGCTTTKWRRGLWQCLAEIRPDTCRTDGSARICFSTKTQLSISSLRCTVKAPALAHRFRSRAGTPKRNV